MPSAAERHFTTGISMITSVGSNGPNVMTAEWTMQISYKPLLIAVFIHKGSKTLKNIQRSKEFGVNVASRDQTTQASIAGGFSGSVMNKLQIKNIFDVFPAKKIKPPLIRGCTINAECRLLQKHNVGDHVMLVGKVMNIVYDANKPPLIFHKGRYFTIGEQIESNREEINIPKPVFEMFHKMSDNQFISKMIGVVVTHNQTLLVRNLSEYGVTSIPIIPIIPRLHHQVILKKLLTKYNISAHVTYAPIIRRVILKNGKNSQRIDFVFYEGMMESIQDEQLEKISKYPYMKSLIKDI